MRSAKDAKAWAPNVQAFARRSSPINCADALIALASARCGPLRRYDHRFPPQPRAGRPGNQKARLSLSAFNRTGPAPGQDPARTVKRSSFEGTGFQPAASIA
ncbi:hypothetical protein AZA_48617 [Nitrospirillum viridazoti Y2]|nr:hypothetical protein AZA_48617 [Nitrospirillum amazonense Y2]